MMLRNARCQDHTWHFQSFMSLEFRKVQIGCALLSQTVAKLGG